MAADGSQVSEVLSPATEKRDRGGKFAVYKTLPPLQEYVLIGSEVQEIIVYQRESNWRPYHYRSGDLVELTGIGVSFPFDAVYRRIHIQSRITPLTLPAATRPHQARSR